MLETYAMHIIFRMKGCIKAQKNIMGKLSREPVWSFGYFVGCLSGFRSYLGTSFKLLNQKNVLLNEILSWSWGINPFMTCLQNIRYQETAMSVSLSKLTVSELKKQLVTAGLKVSGRKADLVQRLLDASEKIQKNQGGRNWRWKVQERRRGKKKNAVSLQALAHARAYPTTLVLSHAPSKEALDLIRKAVNTVFGPKG